MSIPKVSINAYTSSTIVQQASTDKEKVAKTGFSRQKPTEDNIPSEVR